MVSRGDDVWVLYPLYFDRSISRKAGRRVPISLAVEKPKASEIQTVLEKADRASGVEEKSHPSRWDKAQGRVLVSKSSSKEDLIRSVARGIKDLRKSDQRS